MMPPSRTLSVLTLDPDLGRLLSPERRRAAESELQVEVHALGVGPWDARERSVVHGPGQIGLLVLEGVISQELVVLDALSAELLGAGDILRPRGLRDTREMPPPALQWTVHLRARVASLDERFAQRLGNWPEVNAMVIDRLNARAQRLATAQAIAQLNGVERRVLALLWHLAERWGRMTREGVTVPLPLSHRVIGQLVGARRPSVSTAVAELVAARELLRRPDGTWLLKGEPVGLPAPETERVVPIRRRLLGREQPGEARREPAGA